MELTEQQRMDLINAGWTPPVGGRKEVRGIWAKPEHHEKIKAFAESLNKPA